MAGRKQFEPPDALDAAVRVFWRSGYVAASISDLLEAMGVSRGSLYATFGDKQQLFTACLQRYDETVGSASRAAIAGPTADARSLIGTGLEAVLDRMADPSQPAGCLLAQTAAESGALDESIQAQVRRLLDEQVEQIHSLLTADPRLAASRTDQELASMATYFVSVAQALAVMHRAGTAIDELRATARLSLSVLDAPSGREHGGVVH